MKAVIRFGLELAIGNHDRASGKTHGTAWDDPDNPTRRLHPFTDRHERAKLVRMGELAYMDQKLLTALTWIRAHPVAFCRLSARRFRLYWFPPVHAWSASSRARVFKSLVFSLVGVGMFCELVRLARRRHPKAGLLAGVMLGSCLMYAITHVDPRYRYPVFGLSTVLASSFVLAVLEALWCRMSRAGLALRWRRTAQHGIGS